MSSRQLSYSKLPAVAVYVWFESVEAMKKDSITSDSIVSPGHRKICNHYNSYISVGKDCIVHQERKWVIKHNHAHMLRFPP